MRISRIFALVVVLCVATVTVGSLSAQGTGKLRFGVGPHREPAQPGVGEPTGV